MITATAEAIVETPVTPKRLKISYEEYLRSDHEGGLREWVDEELVTHMPPTNDHQRTAEFLYVLLNLFVGLMHAGMVRIAPFSMRSLPGGPAREPDLFFLASENIGRLSNEQLTGPADLVVEVISPDSVGRDRGDKFYEYQEAGVREYWIIDPRPRRQRADFYVLDAQGSYQPVPLPPDGVYRSSALPGFWLNVNWLWREDPKPLAALAEIVGAEQVMKALSEQA